MSNEIQETPDPLADEPPSIAQQGDEARTPGETTSTLSETEARWKAFESVLTERLAEQTRKASEWERACKAAIRDRELATVLAGRPLVPGATGQLIKLWRDDFDVIDEMGTSRVVARDGRGVGQVVSERLVSSEYAHYCQPTSRGGTAPNGIGRPASTGPDPSPPRNLGEVTIRRWMEAATRPGDTSAPIGLSRRRH